MAAKLILSMDGAVLQECVLDKERITIGRKPHNDVVIDNLAVSGEHAAIVTILNDSFLEDLDSTNGVMVNEVSVKKHFLQNNDVIEIGKYKLKYLSDQLGGQASSTDFEKTMVLRSPVNQSAEHVKTTNYEATGKFAAAAINQPDTPAAPVPAAPPLAPVAAKPAPMAADAAPAAQAAVVATVQILSGANAGKEFDLVKNLTTLGKPGVQVAVLTRRPHGYFITHVEGTTYPALNGKKLDDQPQKLNNHDIIELAGIKMEFYFKG